MFAKTRPSRLSGASVPEDAEFPPPSQFTTPGSGVACLTFKPPTLLALLMIHAVTVNSSPLRMSMASVSRDVDCPKLALTIALGSVAWKILVLPLVTA